MYKPAGEILDVLKIGQNPYMGTVYDGILVGFDEAKI
jgi:hypothetical protein